MSRAVTRWDERRMARRYAHRTPWRPCTTLMGGFCLRCSWRTLTGANRRAKAEHIRRVKAFDLTPIRYAKNAEGKWRPVKDADA